MGMGWILLPFNLCVSISADNKLIVVASVEDITTVGSRCDINRLIHHVHSGFKITVKESHKHILRIEIRYTPEGMELSQQQYINKILSRFGMENCTSVSTPIYPTTALLKAPASDPVFAHTL